jgi:hypothetical protein
METQSVAPAVALAPGTVTAQGNRFNTKAAAWQGHKGPPPPPISNQETKAQEAQEKTVQKQADQEAKVEYQQKLLDDKQVRQAHQKGHASNPHGLHKSEAGRVPCRGLWEQRRVLMERWSASSARC